MVALAVALVPAAARAVCNLIPVAAEEFGSLSGSVSQPIALPGDSVTLRIDPFCNPGEPAFDAVASANVVTLRFEPPNGPATDVLVDPADVSVSDCNGGECERLTFVVPDTDDALAPAADGLGLAGPARILVEKGGGTPVAEVADLFEPTRGCDRQPETLFRTFTVLPPANDFSGLQAGSVTRVLATLDGGENLLVPFDYRGVLPQLGSARFRIVEGGADDPAKAGEPFPIQLPPTGFVRSFSPTGRPIPPILRVADDGKTLFGTIDAAEGVLRIQRENPGFDDVYDFTDRFFSDRGPVVLTGLQGFDTGSFAPLPTLSPGAEAVAYARDEEEEGVDLNGDGDANDLVVEILDATTGQALNTGTAVTEVSWDGFEKPALAAEGPLVAVLDRSLFLFATPNPLLVFDAEGNQLNATAFPADPEPLVNGKPLHIEGRWVVSRNREDDGASLFLADVGPQAIAGGTLALSDDGRFLAFVTASSTAPGDANGFWDVYVHDRQSGTTEIASLASDGSQGTADVGSHVAMSGDGRWVAFTTTASLVPADTNGVRDVYVRDRQTATTLLMSFETDGTPNAFPVSPEIDMSGDGRFLVYRADRVRHHDRDTDRNGDFDEPGDVRTRQIGDAVIPAASTVVDSVRVSDDGRLVVFRASDLPGESNVVNDVFLYEISGGALTRVSERPDGTAANGASRFADISGDGRFVAFESAATNLTDDPDPNGSAHDVFVWDGRTGSIEMIRSQPEWMLDPDSVEFPRLSRDGRFVVFQVAVEGLGTAVFRYDQATNRLALAHDLTDFLSGVVANKPAVSADGRFIAYDTFPDGIVVRGGTGLASRNAADSDLLDTVLQVFDAAAGQFVPAAEIPASVAVVADGRVLVVSSEAEDGGANGNAASGDTDSDDGIAKIFDLATSTWTSLGISAAPTAVDLNDQVACLGVRERDENESDLNGDGDTADPVLHVYDLASQTLVNTGQTMVQPPRAIGDACAVVTLERFQGPTVDLNSDGDSDDALLRFWDASDGTLTETLAHAVDIVAGTELVAFRSPEADANADLNGDGDLADEVMHVLDFGVDPPALVNTGRAAGVCDFDGCNPFFEPYRVREATVSFVATEAAQSGSALAPGCAPTGTPGECDLTGDGDAVDTVIQVYSLRADQVQSYEITPAEHPVGTSPFPETVQGKTVLHLQIPESAVGEDVNEDGVVDDTLVLFLMGDADEDGTLDDSASVRDNCAEVANADQTDVDDDGLGDGACDAALTSFVPGATPCDVDRNGWVDQADVDLVFQDRGTAVSTRDVRDSDADGEVTVLDAGLCASVCTYPDCAPPPAPAASSCGLIGIEPGLVLGALAALRRRRRGRVAGAAAGADDPEPAGPGT